MNNALKLLVKSMKSKWRILTLGAKWDRCLVPVYEATGPSGVYPLIKTLLTNKCTNNCTYCPFRAKRKTQRSEWNPEKLAKITLNLWKTQKIKGLFLSSSIPKDPDTVVENQLQVLRNLRKSGFTGYIHIKLMPGVGRHLIAEAVELADRIGINLEAPESEIFQEICPDKGSYNQDIIKRLKWIVAEVEKAREKRQKPQYGFGRFGADTQMIVGATEDDDLQHLETTEWLYKRLGVSRVYYSGFEPQPNTPLENRKPCPKSRTRRLYQASFLIRDYKITAEELAQILDDRLMLPDIDPKKALARLNQHLFPLDVNQATYYELLRIPGIGPKHAREILSYREHKPITRVSDLERVLGAHLARNILPYVQLKYDKLTSYNIKP